MCAYGAFGFTDETVPLTRQQVLTTVHPDDRAIFGDAAYHLTPESPHSQMCYRVVRPDGSTVWLEKRRRAFFDERGITQPGFEVRGGKGYLELAEGCAPDLLRVHRSMWTLVFRGRGDGVDWSKGNATEARRGAEMPVAGASGGET